MKLQDIKKNPNGWGRQNYSGTHIRFIKNHRTDMSRPNEIKSMSFIKKFMTQHVTGLPKRVPGGY